MKSIHQYWRLIQIYFILVRFRIDKVIPKNLSFFRYVRCIFPPYWFCRSAYTRGESIRLAFEALGPVFIKFGQALSTRRDLLPEDVIDELVKLQDQVPPFSGDIAYALLEKTYHAPFSFLFSEFDRQPLASASIAQVHTAKLLNGKEVIIKILRPGIEQKIKQDLAVMHFFARVVSRRSKLWRQFKLQALVSEFEVSVLGELDLLREAANASQLRRSSLSASLYIPEVYWELTRPHVMVMERIYGIPIRQIDQLRAHGVNLKRLAEKGIEIFFTQVFRDAFFHADMHPGNLFVAYQRPEDPQYIMVDFGIMGSLSPSDQRYIAENFLAFFKRDYRRVACLHIESGWAPPHTRIDHLEAAIRTVCEPVFGKPLAEISFGELLLRLIQMATCFDIQVQPQLVLLQKTLLNIEGLGRQLYPQLDLWKTAKPFLEKWIRQQVGPRAFVRKVKEYAPLWLEQMPEWPQLIYHFLQQTNKGLYPQLTQTEVNVTQTPLLVYKKRSFVMQSLFLILFSSAATGWIMHWWQAHHPFDFQTVIDKKSWS